MLMTIAAHEAVAVVMVVSAAVDITVTAGMQGLTPAGIIPAAIHERSAHLITPAIGRLHSLYLWKARCKCGRAI